MVSGTGTGDSTQSVEERSSGTGAGGFNPFCGGEELAFHFEGGFPGGDLADTSFYHNHVCFFMFS